MALQKVLSFLVRYVIIRMSVCDMIYLDMVDMEAVLDDWMAVLLMGLEELSSFCNSVNLSFTSP